jgi:hypothetical protein
MLLKNEGVVVQSIEPIFISVPINKSYDWGDVIKTLFTVRVSQES